jgi:hypothetical protein
MRVLSEEGSIEEQRSLNDGRVTNVKEDATNLERNAAPLEGAGLYRQEVL